MRLMIVSNQETYSPEQLANLIKLRFVEGVFPYLKILLKEDLILKKNKGKYSINKENHKIKSLKKLVEFTQDDTTYLISNKFKKILILFCKKPERRKNELPTTFSEFEKIAKKRRIIYKISNEKKPLFLLATSEFTTKCLLDFFGLKPEFNLDEHNLKIRAIVSSLHSTKTPSSSKETEYLRTQNLKAYFEDADFVLNRLHPLDFNFLQTANMVTKEKHNKLKKENHFTLIKRTEDWKLKYVYNTDKIEGNPLTFEEVRTILTQGGDLELNKKVILETQNSKLALTSIFNTDNEFTEDFIKKLHLATQQSIDENAGSYKIKENAIVNNSQVIVDTTTPVRFVQERMIKLVKWYQHNEKILHPLFLAAVVHNQIAYIHPFSDGNGRVARLLFNFILIKHDFFPIIFENRDKEKYYITLRGAKSGDFTQFLHYCLGKYLNQIDGF